MTDTADSTPPEPTPTVGLELFDTSAPAPTRPPGRKPARTRRTTSRRTLQAVPTAPRPDHTAVYRLYDRRAALLYVGMTNNPLERFVEHRDTKDWWSEVATYSIEWLPTRAIAEDAETAAIKDEWPLHNIAHQPRDNGPYVVPSHVVSQLVQSLRVAVECVFTDATAEQVATVEEHFRRRFDPDVIPGSEIQFAEAQAPAERLPIDLDGVIRALGAFRPPIATSIRVPTEAPAAPVEMFDLTAETLFLRAALRGDDAAKILCTSDGSLRPGDFYDRRNALIYEVILDLWDRDMQVSAPAVQAHLAEMGWLAEVGEDYLGSLPTAPVPLTVRSATFLVEALRDGANRRARQEEAA